MVVCRTCDFILWTSMLSVPLKQSFSFGPISSLLFSGWCGFKSSDCAGELETGRSVTLQDAYLYLLLSLVKHQKAYCFHKSWSCIFRRLVSNWRYPQFHDEGSKGAIQLCKNRPLMPFEMLGSNSHSRRLQIPHRLFLLVQCGSLHVSKICKDQCGESWIKDEILFGILNLLHECGIKTVNKQTQKHVEKGFTLNCWRLVDSSVIL